METMVTENEKQLKVPSTHQIAIGEYFLKFEPEEIEGEFQTKAEKELRETPDVVEEALRTIKLLVQQEPDLHLPECDDFYTKFLRPCKWYPESAFSLIKRFYQFRKNHPHLYVNLTPNMLKNVFTTGLYIPMPNRMDSGARVLYIHGGHKWNPKKISLNEMFQTTILCLEAAMTEPKTQVAGVHVVLDMDGFSLSHVTYFTPSFASMVAHWLQRCLPCRIKGIHIVNQSFIFKMVFAIFKPFLQEKTRKRLHFHGSDVASILAHIDAQALPTNLGGRVVISDASIGEAVWNYFHLYKDRFIEIQQFGYMNTKQ